MLHPCRGGHLRIMQGRCATVVFERRSGDILSLHVSLATFALAVPSGRGMCRDILQPPLEIRMAERKSALKRAPARPDLEEKLARAKTQVLTEEQLREQRASFVYGNAPKGSRITRESAARATTHVRIGVQEVA
jgi:hypothetical protein